MSEDSLKNQGLRFIIKGFLMNGAIKYFPPFSGYEKIYVPELKQFSERFDGSIEAFTTAGASIAPWTFKRMGVGNFLEKTVRWPGFVDFVKDIPKKKFIETISPHINIAVTDENPDLVWMKITAFGYNNGRLETRSYSLLDLFDAETGLTAMEKTTGFATAIIARMIAKGQSATGVHTPETAFNKKQLDILWKELNEYFDIKMILNA